MTQEQENQVEKQCAEAVREIEGDEKMISKELLSAVLGRVITDIEKDYFKFEPNCNDWRITARFDGFNQRFFMNIHELAHKCKEWAKDKNYILKSFIGGRSFCIIESLIGKEVVVDAKIADTEPEAIFKACQWIMEQNK